MHLKSFLKLVEIKTKIASFLPYWLGVVYTLWYFDTINAVNVVLFFISLLSFDMFTTALNNYKDFKKAIKKEGYNYEVHNAIGQFNLKESTVVSIIVILFSVAVVFGILTFLRTDYILLLLGALSFLWEFFIRRDPFLFPGPVSAKYSQVFLWDFLFPSWLFMLLFLKRSPLCFPWTIQPLR